MITLIQSPYKYTPADNPVIFQFESDNPDIVYFKIEILEAVSEFLIERMDTVTTPDYPNGSYADINRIVSNFVKWQVENDTAEKFYLCPREILKYKLKITERGFVAGVMSDLSDPFETTDDYYVWNAKFEKLNFNSQAYHDYIITNGSYNKFLTYKPDQVEVNEYSFEQLFFLHDNETDLYATIQCYPLGLGYHHIPLTDETTNNIYALNVSPKALTDAYGIDISTLESYTVWVMNGTGRITKERTYIYKPLPCHLEPVNLVWVNSIGGIDSYQFVNPQESGKVTRTNIKKNPFKINDDNVYSDVNNGIYNIEDEIINTKYVINVKIWTRILSDAEVNWLGEMVNSKQVFLELTDRTLLPVNLVDTNYTYQKKKYLQNAINVMQFEFMLGENVLPALSDSTYILNTLYYNEERTGIFYKTDCPFGSGPVPVFYVVPAGTFTSNISQDAANALADADMAINGQILADTTGFCEFIATYGNVEQSGEFRRNDCGGGGFYGSLETYVVPADTYFAYTQLEADNMAIADVAANGQAYANSVGSCPSGYGNTIRTGDFTKDDCPFGQIGSTLTYTVPADTYFAATVPDANDLADADIAANGQTYANAHGLCAPAVPTITLTTHTTITTAGGIDTVRAYITSDAPVLDNLTIEWFSYDSTVFPTPIYPLPDIGLPVGLTTTSTILVGSVLAGHGVDIVTSISNIIVPPGGPSVIYTF